MKRRNRQVYRELEERSALLDEMTSYVEPLLKRLELAESQNRAMRLALSACAAAILKVGDEL